MKILIIDDEEAIRKTLGASLEDEAYTVELAKNGDEGLELLKTFQPQICFLDIWMPGSLDGVEVLKKARVEFPGTEFIMISGHGTIETAVRATKLGAWDFIEKPLSIDKVLIALQNLQHYMQEKEEKLAFLNKLRKSIALFGETKEIVQLKKVISEVALGKSWVFLTGEAGVGKELTAQNLHYLSPRASRPFIDMNITQIPEDLLEYELFGFEKGALPGADKTKKGKLELAHGGTIYLEEIAALPKEVLAKLFQALEEKRIFRMGGLKEIPIDVRLVASSLQQLQPGFFPPHELVPLRIPPLRDRLEDLPILVVHFSDQFARESGMHTKTFSEKALELMKGYGWPGNIRELRNFIERVYILTPSEFVDAHDLRFAGLNENQNEEAEWLGNFREARARFEKEYLIRKIQENGGNISKTAETIGLERSYLHRKIKTYGIEVGI